MSKEPNRNVYVGHRYVPKIMGEWDNQNDYEGLSIVTHQGASYTSKKRVPVGIDILNEEFWVVTGNYNAQVENYRQDVINYKQETERVADDLLLKSDQTYVDNELGKKSDQTYVDNQLTQRGHLSSQFDSIQEAIDFAQENEISQTVVVPKNDYELTETLTLKKGVRVEFEKGARLIINHAGDGVVQEQGATVEGELYINAQAFNGWNASAFVVNGSLSTGSAASTFRGTKGVNIVVEGRHVAGKGIGFHLKSDVKPSSISFNDYDVVSARGFEYGVYIDVPPATGTVDNWVNGVLITKLFVSDCDYYYYSTGDHSQRNQASGNIVTSFQFQYSKRAKEMIHIEGQGNQLSGYIWDVTNQDVLAVNLTGTTRRNKININNHLYSENWKDDGHENYLNFRDSASDIVPIKGGVLKNKHGHNTFKGDYADILHGADNIHDVNILQGENLITSGTISDVFNGNGSRALWLNLGDSDRFEFDINFNHSAYKGYTETGGIFGLTQLGFFFDYNRYPKKIIIEVHNADSVKTTTIDTTKHTNENAAIITADSLNGLLVKFTRIKVTLIGSVESNVRLGRVFGSSNRVGGTRFLSTTGGNMLGELDMNNNPIKLGSVDTLPAINNSRYKELYVYDREGEEVKVLIMLRNVNGVPRWYELPIEPFTP